MIRCSEAPPGLPSRAGAWAEGSTLERRIDGVWYGATVSRRGEPGLTGRLARITYDDDGKAEELVPLAECRCREEPGPGVKEADDDDDDDVNAAAARCANPTVFRAAPVMLAPTMSWFDHGLAADADASFSAWLERALGGSSRSSNSGILCCSGGSDGSGGGGGGDSGGVKGGGRGSAAESQAATIAGGDLSPKDWDAWRRRYATLVRLSNVGSH